MIARVLCLALLVTPLADVARAAGPVEWPNLLRAPVSPTGGGERDHVLLIAIEDYAFADSLPPVTGAATNGYAWESWFAKVRKVPPHANQTRTLYNRDAKAKYIRTVAQDLAKHSRDNPGGTFWLVFIGHGTRPKEPGTRGGLLVGVTADKDTLYDPDQSVPLDELLRIIDTGAQERTVAVIDACFSGLRSDGKPLVAGEQPAVPVEPLEVRPETLLLSAATDKEFAGSLPGTREGEERPAFSYLVLGGLRGWADRDHSGKVTGNELRDYALDALRTFNVHGQTPTIQGDVGPVVELPVNEDAPDLAELYRESRGLGPVIRGEDERADSGFGPWPWVALGASVVAMGVGTGFIIDGTADWDAVTPTMLKSEADALVESGDQKRTIGFVTGGIGIGLMVTGVVLLVLEPDDTPAVSLMPTTSGFASSLSWGF